MKFCRRNSEKSKDTIKEGEKLLSLIKYTTKNESINTYILLFFFYSSITPGSAITRTQHRPHVSFEFST